MLSTRSLTASVGGATCHLETTRCKHLAQILSKFKGHRVQSLFSFDLKVLRGRPKRFVIDEFGSLLQFEQRFLHRYCVGFCLARKRSSLLERACSHAQRLGPGL